MKNLIEILNNHPKVDEWQIISTNTSSNELFFIKDKLQMNRAKDVSKDIITVFKNFEIDGKKFKGSSSTNLSSIYTSEEIIKKIDQAALAASFVKNEYYDIPNPTDDKALKIESLFETRDFLKAIGNLVKDLYEEDKQFNAFVNSSEFFINKRNVSIKNSKGIDVSFVNYNGEIELITEAQGKVESIELFDTIYFSDYDQEAIKKAIKEQLYNTSLRALAVPLPNVGEIPVILTGKSSMELWNYYRVQADAGQKYQHVHNNNIGDNIQGEGILGDKVTITLKPVIPNSIYNRYYDSDGMFLKEKLIIEDGVLKNFCATKRYADYLNIEPTGNIGNVVVKQGSLSEKELKQGKYLEVISFSAFQSDPITGDFGGEFRLGIYFDGEKEIPVTLGTVSANIKDAQKEMFLSKELVRANNFIAPKIIKFNKMTIAGN
jgi:PmbA protein